MASFPLRLAGKSATMELRSRSWLTPRFGLAPSSVCAEGGALTQSIYGGGGIRHLPFATAQRLTTLSRSYLKPRTQRECLTLPPYSQDKTDKIILAYLLLFWYKQQQWRCSMALTVSPEVQEAEKRKRMRSPAYPYINLEAAIKRAQEFYNKEQRNAAPLKVAVKHWGYEEKS